ncbi:MAG: 1-acyl-sn-glycerol-3-phosphate acyltransferase [Polyangiaceae bacterium]|jgi:glycerol-3-phosphate O-acyltransferase|nr:1-acyl-sn-glycerol-3-phosphate acyltransferase [Polyangiaceae bacterium]
MRRDAPIFRFNDARGAIEDEVVRRVMERVGDPTALLEDAIYNEVRRLSASDSEGELARWRSLARRLRTLDPDARRREVQAIAREHAHDVSGNFDPRVFALATRLMPPVLGALVAPKATFTSLRRLLDARALADRVTVEGHTRQVARLVEKGTVVYVPTHLSNMDSIVFGYALDLAGLPPATYGAGKNLFTNPVLSFFMHNLGAYKVDRRLRHALYKDVLKVYSCVLIEQGYHSLFFPGGTRSRSGGVERRLKLGLAGTGVEAFARTAQRGQAKKVFFVPSTINYLVTLEAQTLIGDFLQDAGKARFIIDDDESSRIEKVVAFSNKMLKHNEAVVIRFGEPVDPFGNRVDDEGNSLDARGNPIDPLSYLKNRRGELVVDADRDAQYTRELGEVICDAYLRHTVILPTHLIAAAMMNRLREDAGTSDIFTLLRVRQKVGVPWSQLATDATRLRDALREQELRGRVVLGPTVREGNGDTLLAEALRAWQGSHRSPVLEEVNGELWIGDATLVFYYQNRLAAHGVALDVLAPRRERGAA